ncbi:hypothetical protein Q3G72_001039 [Acer saccharum]|nr:hypothetical protein Q3G72_001039 [Acer saccharum]
MRQRLHDNFPALCRLYAGGDAVVSWYNSVNDPSSHLFKVAMTPDGSTLLWFMGIVGVAIIFDVLINDWTPDWVHIGPFSLQLTWHRAFQYRHFLFVALAMCYAAQPYVAARAEFGYRVLGREAANKGNTVAKSLQQLKFAVWIYLTLFWCFAAYGADSTLVQGLEAIPLKAALYVLVLSVVGGAAGTLNKLAQPDLQIRNLPLEIAKDTIMSVVAGMLTFFMTSWISVITFWPQAILITVAGYGGSKVLDLALADGLIPWLQRVFGKVQNTGGGQ